MAKKKTKKGAKTAKTAKVETKAKEIKTRPPKKSKKDTSNLPKIECLECGHEARCLTSHLKNSHDMTGKEYRTKHNGAPLFAPDLQADFAKKGREGVSNKWNKFVKLYQTLSDVEKDKVIALAEKITGKTLEDFAV